MKKTRHLGVISLSAGVTGCMVGANYKGPSVSVPPPFPAGGAQPSQTSLGDVKWFNVFDDSALHDLIAEALKANYDVNIAAQRVLQAQGLLQATRSAVAPQLNLQSDATRAGLVSPIQSVGRGF